MQSQFEAIAIIRENSHLSYNVFECKKFVFWEWLHKLPVFGHRRSELLHWLFPLFLRIFFPLLTELFLITYETFFSILIKKLKINFSTLQRYAYPWRHAVSENLADLPISTRFLWYQSGKFLGLGRNFGEGVKNGLKYWVRPVDHPFGVKIVNSDQGTLEMVAERFYPRMKGATNIDPIRRNTALKAISRPFQQRAVIWLK